MKKIAIAACVLSELVGCTTQMSRSAESTYSQQESRINKINAQQAALAQEGNSATSAVKGIWLGAKSLPFKNDLALPGVFYARKDFLFPRERMTIAQVADRFQSVTGIPVRIANDVYNVAKIAAPVIAAPAAPAVAAPSLPPLPGSLLGAQSLPTVTVPTDLSGLSGIVMNTTATPSVLLDQICNSIGLSWEYKNGAVHIQRYVTRSFVLKVSPGSSSFSFSSGKSNSATAAASGGGGISTGFSSESNVKSSGTMAPMDSMLAAVTAVLTPVGKVIGSSATGSIIVVDSIDGVERAAKVIERENEILTRNAYFHVEVLSFTDNDISETGVDLNGMFSQIGKFGATLAGPTSLVSSTAGALGLNVVAPLTGGLQHKFNGSEAVIKALSQYGKVSTVHSLDVVTRNRNLTPLAIQTQTVYLAQTTPGTAATAGGAAGAPGLTPGVVTTGFNMTLQPNILDSNQMSLQFQIGLIDLIEIKTLTSGAGSTQQSIEAPQSAGFEFKQDVFLHTGETMVLSGYERKESGYTTRRLGKDLPIFAGGSVAGKTKKERIYILITPTVVGSAN